MIRQPCVWARNHRVIGGVIKKNIVFSLPQMKRTYSSLQNTSELEPVPKRSRKRMATTTIKLTDREAQLRDLLLDVARYIDESKEIKDEIELRFAGGWVRDKLLGIQSHDIDTAINAMTGYSFSMKMKEYLSSEENMKKHSIEANDIGNLHKIAANPEKSKHLETVTTKIFGFDVDFVNLRKETYSEDSRNPQMEFGTAEEDALRRDATINALFYNLHTDLVEDFTGGLRDMDAKHIRTPLDPYTTFMDDPLRVLRLIRFASRLGFEIDKDSEISMSDMSVQHALEVKISRERVGVELEKMLKGPDPRRSLQIIDRLRLYSTIFTDPTNNGLPQPATSSWSKAYNCVEQLKSNETPGSIYRVLVRSDDAKYLSWLLAALAPWAGLHPPAKAGGKLPVPYATAVAREGIKADNKVCNVVTGALRNYDEITSFKAAVKEDRPVIRERDTLGMAIRRWESQGGHWRLQVLYALLVEVLNSSCVTDQILSEWQTFLDHLDKMDIMDAPSIKPLVDGTRLTKDLKAKPGPWMKSALDICMAWQLRNPDERDPSEAIESVRNNKELNVQYV
ncbi:tRNA nucleotidyltransferase-like protein [Xylogone sp. PMI_703]|nr:tRNA nucleotidyltransferase-like protein [Xylogone sp. PMI_703]